MSDTLVGNPLTATAVDTVSAALAAGLDNLFAPELTLHDRCDGCGAAAKVQVLVGDSSILLLCGHHFNRSKAALTAAGTLWRAGDCNEHDAYNCDCTDKVMKSRTQGLA